MSEFEMYKQTQVLVTGAGGFIGSHLTEALASAGAKVTALLHYNHDRSLGNLNLRNAPNCKPIWGDIRDPYFIQKVVKDTVYTHIFHLAALIDIPHSYTNSSSYIETNVIGTHNILEACLLDYPMLIHTSTSEVYGTAQTDFIKESHQLRPHSPYAATKIAADALVQSYSKAHMVEATILRPFNVGGPRQSDRAVLSSIVKQLLDPILPKVLLGDVTPKRSITHVKDTVNAFMLAGLALHYPSPINIGVDKSYSILELFNMAKHISGIDKPLQIDTDRMRPSDVMALCPDITLAKKFLGWEPKHDISEVIGDLIRSQSSDS